jgi:hypothetical protein
MSIKSWKPKKNPWEPPDYDDGVVYAIRALHGGVANDGQQKLAWSWIMYITGAGEEWADLSFRPGQNGDRDTTFAEGKRFPGLQLRKMLHPSVTPKQLPTEAKRK